MFLFPQNTLKKRKNCNYKFVFSQTKPICSTTSTENKSAIYENLQQAKTVKINVYFPHTVNRCVFPTTLSLRINHPLVFDTARWLSNWPVTTRGPPIQCLLVFQRPATLATIETRQRRNKPHRARKTGENFHVFEDAPLPSSRSSRRGAGQHSLELAQQAASQQRIKPAHYRIIAKSLSLTEQK